MRGEEHRAVRDNVLIELGIFIGRLGRERSFIVKPRDIQEFHLPSDLLGLTSLTYHPSRQDGNLQAALGPACNHLRSVFAKTSSAFSSAELGETVMPDLSEADILAILQSWMNSRDTRLNTQIIKYSEVDQELKLPSGSTQRYIEKVASRLSYKVEHKGERNILFRDSPPIPIVATAPHRKNWIHDY